VNSNIITATGIETGSTFLTRPHRGRFFAVRNQNLHRSLVHAYDVREIDGDRIVRAESI